jgi:hypothetical protein
MHIYAVNLNTAGLPARHCTNTSYYCGLTLCCTTRGSPTYSLRPHVQMNVLHVQMNDVVLEALRVSCDCNSECFDLRHGHSVSRISEDASVRT